MILNVTCPHCSALLDVAPAWLGKPMECGGCGSVFPCPDIAEEGPDENTPKIAREKASRRKRDRDRDRENDDRWDGYDEYSRDGDPDSYLGKKRGPGFATTSMILGICSILIGSLITVFTCGFGGFIQIIASIVGIVLGYLGIRSDGKVNAIAGMVMNALGALFAVLWMTLFGALFSGTVFKGAAPPTAATKAAATWKAGNPPPQPGMPNKR